MAPTTESYSSDNLPPPSSGIFLIRPAITRHTSIALLSFSSAPTSALSWARPLVAVVSMPFSVGPSLWSLNPLLIMAHTLQCGMELQRLEDPLRPNEHLKVVQWNLKSSFPSAMHLGCFLGSFVALDLMKSLYSSNLFIVLWVFWTLRILSIWHTGVCFSSQLDWNIISTMFLLVSSAPNSETATKKSVKIHKFSRPEQNASGNWPIYLFCGAI